MLNPREYSYIHKKKNTLNYVNSTCKIFFFTLLDDTKRQTPSKQNLSYSKNPIIDLRNSPFPERARNSNGESHGSKKDDKSIRSSAASIMSTAISNKRKQIHFPKKILN